MVTKLFMILVISMIIFALMTVLEALRMSNDSHSHKYLRDKKIKTKTCIEEDKL